jgi:imidazole glycerol-phosphate synthase subunit HisF
MPKIYKGTYPMYYGASKLIRERAKELRLNLTAEEKMLWAYISNKQLGARFRRQHL